LDTESWRAQVEVVTADVLDRTSLGVAFDVDAAYYLVHSIGSQSDWQTRQRYVAADEGGQHRQTLVVLARRPDSRFSLGFFLVTRMITFYFLYNHIEDPQTTNLMLRHRKRELTVWWAMTIFNLIAGVAIGWLLSPSTGWPTQEQWSILFCISVALNFTTFAGSKYLIPEYKPEPYGKHYKHE